MRLMNHSAHIFLDGNRALIESNLFRHAPNTPNSVTRYFEKELVKNDPATRTFHFGSLELTGKLYFLAFEVILHGLNFSR